MTWKRPHFEMIAGIIRSLPDGVRTEVADHFADAFSQKFPAFDPGAWSDRTGGRVGRSKLMERAEAERRERVARYMEISSITQDRKPHA